MKSVRIRSYFGQHFPLIRTEHGEIRSIQSECGKMRTRITPNANIFYAVEDNKWMIHPSPRNATKLFVFNQEKSDMRMIYYPSLRGTTNVAIVANESKEMVFHICKPFETRSILWKYWPQVSKLLQKYEKFGYVADIDATIGDIEERSIQTE